ncbi:MAG: sulfite exporter TauE/SafE family protein [Desulfobacterales bacterium]
MGDLDLISLFLLGLLGTGHCIGMCGPLVVAFPGRTGRVAPHLFYHLGRLVTYGGIGAMMGGIGSGLAMVSSVTGSDHLQLVARLQITLSVVSAGFLLYFGLCQLGFFKQPQWMRLAAPEKIPGYRRIIRLAFVNQGAAEMLFTGLLMGFLPCGLSFAAFSRALAAGGFLDGFLLLSAFGIGTLPGLLLIGTGASALARRYQHHSDIIAGLLMIVMGLSLGLKAITAG